MFLNQQVDQQLNQQVKDIENEINGSFLIANNYDENNQIKLKQRNDVFLEGLDDLNDNDLGFQPIITNQNKESRNSLTSEFFKSSKFDNLLKNSHNNEQPSESGSFFNLPYFKWPLVNLKEDENNLREDENNQKEDEKNQKEEKKVENHESSKGNVLQEKNVFFKKRENLSEKEPQFEINKEKTAVKSETDQQKPDKSGCNENLTIQMLQSELNKLKETHKRMFAVKGKIYQAVEKEIENFKRQIQDQSDENLKIYKEEIEKLRFENENYKTEIKNLKSECEKYKIVYNKLKIKFKEIVTKK
ncbi:hypothetical protein M153_1100055543 [Pseudoloma neurophilia]|uniref:Uncharacterized protein n=1 Tax=Pseudoloma neurophilia TaxID=146866 RepID=A0A0R0M1G6_9MICR|nr:hypothetical protein M153_1100055543 [Pseudoloma neurophilia]